jgi:long-chain fatty acid transport protein
MHSLLAALLLAPTADAAGYYTSDVGVRAFSRGGAYVAGANDMLALWYNPAALTRVGNGLLTVDAAGVNQRVHFDRKDYPGEGPLDEDGQPTDLINDPITNGAKTFVIPHMGAAWDFGLPDTTFAIGFYPPYAPDYAYPSQGPQRYTLVDTLVIQTFTGASVAHRLWDRLSVGAGVSWNLLKVEQELKVSIPQNVADLTANEDPKYDVGFAMSANDPSALAWNVGLLYEPPSNRWAIGGMVQAPITFNATGTMQADFRGNFFRDDDVVGVVQQDFARDEEVTLQVTMPLIVKAGALVRPTDNWEIEVATVYEGWSSIDQIVVKDINLNVPLDQDNAIVQALGMEDISITDDVVLPAGYEDSWSIRLGTEWQANDKLTLRAGGLYETSAIPESNQGVSLLDGDKWGYGLGGTHHFSKRVSYDLGWFQSFIPERRIEGSSLKSIIVNWQTGEIVDGRNIGDGVLSSSAILFGAGLNYHFGSAPLRTRKLGHNKPDAG